MEGWRFGDSRVPKRDVSDLVQQALSSPSASLCSGVPEATGWNTDALSLSCGPPTVGEPRTPDLSP